MRMNFYQLFQKRYEANCVCGYIGCSDRTFCEVTPFFLFSPKNQKTSQKKAAYINSVSLGTSIRITPLFEGFLYRCSGKKADDGLLQDIIVKTRKKIGISIKG
ncbi:unnamed protein product [Amoebophrya sp. A120]|nr:unnamed protein product [Amoebophrya sp. A120]|eukprot:GSA120T00014124001.1